MKAVLFIIMGLALIVLNTYIITSITSNIVIGLIESFSFGYILGHYGAKIYFNS